MSEMHCENICSKLTVPASARAEGLDWVPPAHSAADLNSPLQIQQSLLQIIKLAIGQPAWLV